MRREKVLLLMLSICQLAMVGANAAAPVVYKTPHFQTTVRGAPDDLLMIAGSGFAATDTVVYQRIYNTNAALFQPSGLPAANTDVSGIAPVVDSSALPNSLTVRLPTEMQADQSYALWVRNVQGQWSAPIRINDARPMWVTPAFVYSTAQVASLPREIKVVGRNLQPAPGAVTKVRLIGPKTFTLAAFNDNNSETTIEHYSARVSLPAQLPAGLYTIKVQRDGAAWEVLSGQQLEVRDDPSRMLEFPISAVSSGGCQPNDGQDDTACLLAAVASAKNAGGGVVTLSSGNWDLVNSSTPGVISGEGILLPVGVSLEGAGSTVTTLLRHAAWTEAATITLQGRNTVKGLRLKDSRTYTDLQTRTYFLKLGKRFDRVNSNDPSDPAYVDDVVITQNIFDKPFMAIVDGGLPIHRLFVTFNEIGAYSGGFFLDGYNTSARFRIDDSVFSQNIFFPGSDLRMSENQGVIASQVGASYRVDFSDNVADGTSTEFLNSPTDARGWRAAFFWHLRDNHELMLLSNNDAACTGDKTGDGEAFVVDDNHNSYGFEKPPQVVSSTGNTVTVAGVLRSHPDGYAVDVSNFYVGQWITVVDGAGIGQARRVVSYQIDPATNQVAFTVAPKWDVRPVANTGRIVLGRMIWQTFIVDNFVDHRQPQCLKSNRYRPKGGAISYYGRTADSTIEGNRQYDTDGIALALTHSAVDSTCEYANACTYPTDMQQSFTEIRNNVVDGEYDWSASCSWSGIGFGVGGSPSPASPIPTLGYGISIAHNTINRADGFQGGAISISRGWYAGPYPNNWKQADNTLIYKNTIGDINGAATVLVPGQCPGYQRFGIGLLDPLAWRSKLYKNVCQNVTNKLVDSASQTVKVCSSPSDADSCECQ